MERGNAVEFDHERLEVYVMAVDFVIRYSGLSKVIPKGSAYLVNQLQRASSSIALNIAEGAGEFSPAEKAKFYRIARRSGFECAAILDIAKGLGFLSEDGYHAAKGMLLKIVSMLIQLSKGAEIRARAGARARAGEAEWSEPDSGVGCLDGAQPDGFHSA